MEAGRRRNHWHNFQMRVPSFPVGSCSLSFMCLVFGPCEENISMQKNRSRHVFKVSTSTRTFQSLGSFSVHRDPLECHLLFSNCKAFLPGSFPLRISSLLSCPFFLCEPSPPPPPPLAGSFGLTPFVSVISQIRGLRFGGVPVQILLGQHLRSQWERSLIAQCEWWLIDSNFVVKPKI